MKGMYILLQSKEDDRVRDDVWITLKVIPYLNSDFQKTLDKKV